MLGKDRIIFVTKEDHETPSNAELVADDPNDPYEEHGERHGPPGDPQTLPGGSVHNSFPILSWPSLSIWVPF